MLKRKVERLTLLPMLFNLRNRLGVNTNGAAAYAVMNTIAYCSGGVFTYRLREEKRTKV